MNQQQDFLTADVHKLVKIIQRLTEGGNTVVVIEHNLDGYQNGRLYYRFRTRREEIMEEQL